MVSLRLNKTNSVMAGNRENPNSPAWASLKIGMATSTKMRMTPIMTPIPVRRIPIFEIFVVCFNMSNQWYIMEVIFLPRQQFHQSSR